MKPVNPTVWQAAKHSWGGQAGFFNRASGGRPTPTGKGPRDTYIRHDGERSEAPCVVWARTVPEVLACAGARWSHREKGQSQASLRATVQDYYFFSSSEEEDGKRVMSTPSCDLTGAVSMVREVPSLLLVFCFFYLAMFWGKKMKILVGGEKKRENYPKMEIQTLPQHDLMGCRMNSTPLLRLFGAISRILSFCVSTPFRYYDLQTGRNQLRQGPFFFLSWHDLKV